MFTTDLFHGRVLQPNKRRLERQGQRLSSRHNLSSATSPLRTRSRRTSIGRRTASRKAGGTLTSTVAGLLARWSYTRTRNPFCLLPVINHSTHSGLAFGFIMGLGPRPQRLKVNYKHSFCLVVPAICTDCILCVTVLPHVIMANK